MSEWWSSLSGVNLLFYCLAAFFSVFFVWQLIMALIGITGGDSLEDAPVGDVDDFEPGAHHHSDAADTVATFKLLSIRSIITFCTLFSWGTALYLDRGDSLIKAMGISSIWGLAGMVSIAIVVYLLLKLVHTGTRNLNSCVGTDGTVYLDIPENGTGEVRVLVSGTVSFVRARGVSGKALKAGTPIRVLKRLDQTLIEVEPRQ